MFIIIRFERLRLKVGCMQAAGSFEFRVPISATMGARGTAAPS